MNHLLLHWNGITGGFGGKVVSIDYGRVGSAGAVGGCEDYVAGD
jgi:hypothetical protein